MLRTFTLFLLAVFSAFSQASNICHSIEDTSYEGGCVITADISYPEDTNYQNYPPAYRELLSNNSSQSGRGRLLVRNFSTGEGEQRYDKPIVIVAPYALFLTEEVSYSSDEEFLRDVLVESFNGGKTSADIISDYGDHDIFLFSYTTDNGFFDYIQRNSLALLKGLTWINKINGYSPSNSIAIMGSSLGGLVSKYALAYANSNDIAVNVRTWVTLDSPLRGANLPMSYQYLPKFLLNMLHDFGNIGGLDVDYLSSIAFLASIGVGVDFTLATLASFGTEEYITELNNQRAQSRALAQISRDYIQSTSSKQLLINHFEHSSGSLKNQLQSELDSMDLGNNLRKVAFTSTDIEQNYSPNYNDLKLLINSPSKSTPDLRDFSLQFYEIQPGIDGTAKLFKGYARLDRIGPDDKRRENVISLNEFPYYQAVNHVSGTTTDASAALVKTLNSDIYGLDEHAQILHEPTFIPSYSALDLDPEVYGYDLSLLPAKDITTLKQLSPFDEIYSLSSRVHAHTLSLQEQQNIYAELTSRHDLAYLTVIVNSILLN